MNKKTVILTLALALPFAVMASPDEQGWGEGHHGNRIEHLTNELGLSADQKTKLETIFKEQKEKFKALHEENRKLISEVLTTEQNQKYDALIKQRHEKWQKKHDGLNNNPQK